MLPRPPRRMRDRTRKEKIRELDLQTHVNEEFLLDVPFTIEEVSGVVSKLRKKKKATGPDGMLGEHLKAGGEYLW